MRTDSINKAVSSFEYNEISLEEEGKFSVNTRFAAGAALLMRCVGENYTASAVATMTMAQKIPMRFHGKWAVVSAKTADGKEWGGEILDEWVISETTVQNDAGLLHVKKVEEDIEPDQDMVLLSFQETHTQYALMSAKNQPDVVLVITYLNRQEQMRQLITQAVYRNEPRYNPTSESS